MAVCQLAFDLVPEVRIYICTPCASAYLYPVCLCPATAATAATAAAHEDKFFMKPLFRFTTPR